MTFGFQPSSEGGEIVDFAVKDRPNGTVFVGQGLIATGEVNDGKSSKAQGSMVVTVLADIVWSSMDHSVRHGRERFGCY